MNRRHWSRWLISCPLLLLSAGCEEDDPQSPGGPEMVLVQGVVIDIDRVRPAEGVRVVLLSDESITSTEPTGSDGAYTMRVPKGTRFQVITEDFDAAGADWFPMINSEYPGFTIEEPRSDLLVHACPTAESFPAFEGDLPAGSGGVASWNAYLADCEDPDYPRFGIDSVEDAKGIVLLVGFESVQQSCGRTAGLSFALDDEAFTIGYLDADKEWFEPGRDTCYFQPVAGAATEASGVAFAFAGPGLTTDSVTLSIVDTNLDRGLEYPAFDVPVRFGAATMVFVGRVDGQGGKHVVDCLCDCDGAPPGVVCE